MIPGWTATLAQWQQNRRRAAAADDGFTADMADMKAAAGIIFGALDLLEGADRQRVTPGLVAALALPPFYPLAEQILDDKIKVRRVVVACVEVDRHGKTVEVSA